MPGKQTHSFTGEPPSASMLGSRSHLEGLQRENQELRARLTEAEDALRAIRSGDVEALVIETPSGPQVFSLPSAEASLNQLHSAMLNGVTDALIAADSDGRVIYLNPAAERLCETTSTAALGQELPKIIGPPLLPGDISLPPLSPRHGTGFRRAADGRQLEYEFSLSPLSPARESPPGTVIVLRDITFRVAAQEALRASEDFTRRITDIAPSILYVYDLVEHRNIWGNRGMVASLGYSRDQIDALAGNLIQELLHPLDLPGYQCHLARIQALADGAIAEFEYRLRRADGSWCWLCSRDAVFLRDAGGTPRQIIGAALDVTAQKRMQTALSESEQRYRLLFDRNPDGVFSVDADGRFIIANPACEKLSGYSQSELLGMTFLDLCAPDQLASTLEHFQRQTRLESPAYSEFETAIVQKGGARLEVLISGERHVFGERVVAVHGTAKNITARVLAERQLRLSEERLRLAAFTANFGVHDFDVARDCSYWSAELYEISGVPPGTRISRDFLQRHIHPDDRERVLQRMAAALDPGDSGGFDEEFRIVRPIDGQVRWIHNRCKTIFEGEGEMRRPVRATGVVIDITTRREFQLELERLVSERTARLQELVNELEHFSYSITHDLRAPLRAMASFADIALELSGAPHQVEEQRHILGRIRQATMRMDELIRDALKYNEAIRKQLPLTPVDVTRLLRGMLDSYPELQEAAGQIHLTSPLPQVLANEAGLTQCFSNLLLNAINFAHPNRPLHIRIWAELLESPQVDLPDFRGEPKPFQPAGFTPVPPASAPGSSSPDASRRVRIWVEDNGVGISEVLLPRIFNMFMRGTSGKPGTGIGLALVRKVVDRMGGLVGVQSVPDQGARFWIELACADPLPACPNPLA